MDFLADLIQYQFLRNALVAAVLSGVTCGMVGAYVVFRRAVFLSGGITHASFGGIGLAYFAGWNPLVGATLVALLSAVGIEWAADRVKIREDSAIGIIWSVGMALGIIFIALSPGYAPNLVAILFGNILTVTTPDLISSSALAVVVLAMFALWMRPLIYVAFDREFARTQGVPVKLISYTMAVVTALTIVFSIRAVGIVLLISLLTFPAVIVNSLTKSFRRIIVWSAVVATAANIAGLIVSHTMDIPTGAATIFVLTVSLIIVKSIPLLFRKITGPDAYNQNSR
ncbi:MAG: metal ABC transporter permease [Rikenellaceae bacterium]|jgi:zinc transport system permease protein|nr:metal ABC transporter permease [Rikenellaceae bacterium]